MSVLPARKLASPLPLILWKGVRPCGGLVAFDVRYGSHCNLGNNNATTSTNVVAYEASLDGGVKMQDDMS